MPCSLLPKLQGQACRQPLEGACVSNNVRQRAHTIIGEGGRLRADKGIWVGINIHAPKGRARRAVARALLDWTRSGMRRGTWKQLVSTSSASARPSLRASLRPSALRRRARHFPRRLRRRYIPSGLSLLRLWPSLLVCGASLYVPRICAPGGELCQ